MADVKISSAVQRRIDLLGQVAADLTEKKEKAIEEFEDVLERVKQAFESAADQGDNEDDERGMSAEELFQEDPIYDELQEIAKALGGTIGESSHGIYGYFEFRVDDEDR